MNTSSQATTFAYQTARLSWVCPIVAFFLVAFAQPIGARMIPDLMAGLLIVVGFILGVIALFGISKHGSKGILAPAIVGIIISGLFVVVWIVIAGGA
jgi:hypothetical protein